MSKLIFSNSSTIEQTISLAPAPQIITFDSVEVNPEVEDGVFAFPEG